MSTGSTKPKTGRFTAREREIVRNAYPGLGPAALARKLGRSKSGVCKLIREMKESGEIVEAGSTERATEEPPPGTLDEGSGTQDTLGRLRRLRDHLERQLYDAQPAQVRGISAEYRATLEAIDRLENTEGGDDGDDVLDRLAGALLGHRGG